MFVQGRHSSGYSCRQRQLATLASLSLLLTLVTPRPSDGQPPPPPAITETLPLFEPLSPISPAVIARDDQGRVTVRVTRLASALVLDGELNEPVYSTVPAFGDFIQQEPDEGQPATERSEVWMFFDDDNVYVSARFWKSAPADLIANEMRKDESGISRNDSISVVLDTFYDRRSGYYFNTNALGAVRDALRSTRTRTRTWTSTQSGMCAVIASPGAGRRRWLFRSSRFGIGLAASRSGAC